MCAITRSPGMNPCTPSPTCLTTPASSLPGEKGSSGLNWYLFWMRRTSGKFTPLAFTDTRSCPLAGAGDGMSSTTSASGGPQLLHSPAVMRALLRSWRHHSRVAVSATIGGLRCAEGGSHGRKRDAARAAVRRFLETVPGVHHRLGDHPAGHPYRCLGHLRPPIHRAVWAGENPDLRRLGARCASSAGSDSLLAVPRRNAGEDADWGKDRQCEDTGQAFYGSADWPVLRVHRFHASRHSI